MATLLAARPLLAALPEFPSVGESLVFQLTGLVVVFTALGSIWGLLELMGWAFRVAARAKQSAAHPAFTGATAHANTKIAAPPSTAKPAEPPTPTPPPGATNPAVEIAAVISACAYLATEGRPFRIVSVVPVEPHLDWAREGRREIWASHKTH